VRWFHFSLGLLGLGLTACQQAYPQPLSPPAPLPQEPHIQAYFNQVLSSRYTDPYRQQERPGDDLEQTIINAIATAQTSIDIAVQEFRLPRVAQALRDRQQAGIQIRIILENIYSQPYSTYSPQQIAQLPEREKSRYDEATRLIDQDGNGQLSATEIEERDALVMLDQADIPRIDDTADGSAGSNLMHHKFMVVDGKTVISTSANWTLSDVHGDLKTTKSRGNANNLLQIENTKLAAAFTKEFNLMWGDGPGRKPDSRFGVKKPYRPAQLIKVDDVLVQVQFSPSGRAIAWQYTTNGLIGRTLQRAQETINLALFVFSDQQLVNRLEPLHQSEVEIRALIEPGFAFRPYSEILDMLGVTLQNDCKIEADNRPWQQPITSVGVPRLPPGDLLHHKFGVVDGQIVITGSHNWTEAANRGNDETLLVIYSPTVAAHYQQEFERLYTDAIVGLPSAIRKKAAQHAIACPTPALTQPPLPSRRTTVTASQRSPQPTVLVNLNTASQKELEALPGIGKKLAQRIIAARQNHPFRSLEDLRQIPGIKAKQLQKLHGKVTW